MTEEERSDRRRRRAALLLIPALLLGAAFCFWTLFASVSLGEAESFIPAPLGSDALANYGKDDLPGRLRSLSISIVEAVIRDRDPEEENVDSRVDNVIDSLKSPVPTVPGAATGTLTSAPTTTPTPNPSVTGTLTATGSPSPTPTSSRTPSATNTEVPTAGPSPTPTECSATPVVIIVTPDNGAHYRLNEELPGRALAYDPDNASPICAEVTPIPNGDGIDHVDFEIKSEASGWSVVHFEDQDGADYCTFDDGSPCNLHDLSTGLWPTPSPIELGKHIMYAKAWDDDGNWNEDSVVFWIDPSIITVENVSATEGSDLTFTVTLDIEVPSAFTVNVSLTDVTATGGSPLVSPKDYDNLVATLNFSGTSGETQQFTVATLDDAVLEGAETFTVLLNASSPWVTDTDTSTGTINDNDTAQVTVNIDTEVEGTGLLFTVTLDNAVQGAFNVNIALSGGSANGGSAPLVSPEDYNNVVTALNFAGSASETQQFTVATLDDASVESTETFTVFLDATNPLVTDSDTGTGTITDNDIASCPDFALSNFEDDDDQKLWWRLTNTSSTVSATIVQIDLAWTDGGKLKKIRLNSSDIWNTEANPTFVSISSGWKAPSRLFDPQEFKELRFEFESAVSGNYSVTVYSADCTSVPVTNSPD